MKACIHVDYLSHEWTASDAIRAYSQVRKEIRKLKSKQRSSNPFDAKAQRALRVENQLLSRFENALWRQMSRTCTPLLGGHNPMVHPSTVNWQKESDITWLYGPLYSHQDDNQDEPIPTTAAQRLSPYSDNHGLKPVLKKTSGCSSPDYTANLLYMRRGSSVIAFDNTYFDSQRTSFSSVSSSEFSAPTPPNNVRFSPETTKVQYYIPESPVQELGAATTTLHDQWNPYWTLHGHNLFDDNDDDDDENDDALWDLLVNVSQNVKQTALGWLMPPQRQHQHEQQANIANIIVTLMSVAKSATSLMATWLMYQTLLKIVHTRNMHSGKRRSSLIDKRSLALSIITWWRWQKPDERRYPASSASAADSS